MDSILKTIRKASGIDPEDTDFDIDLIPFTNSVIDIVAQLGVGNIGDFILEDETQTWSDYLGEQERRLSMVKTYIGSKVRLMFDPPQSSTSKSALEDSLKELESRIIYTLEIMEENNG